MKTTKILTVCALALLLVGLGSAPALAQDNASGGTSPEVFPCPGLVVSLTFDLAGDAFVFNLAPSANGVAAVSTRDLFLFGPDIWRAELHEVGKPGKSKSGTGSQTNFTGRVSKGVKVGRSYQAIISPDDIPAGFGAGMEACFEGPVIVTGPLAE